LPWRRGARRVQICRCDRIEADRHQPLRVYAEPAKPYPPLAAIEPLGFDKDFERYPLRPGRITKVIEISQKILDLEPHDRATVFAGATVSSSWFLDAGQAGVPDCRRNVDGQN